jgi:hypothetical protein
MLFSSAESHGEASRTNSAVVKSAELSTWNQWATLHQKADLSSSPVDKQANYDCNPARIEHQDLVEQDWSTSMLIAKLTRLTQNVQKKADHQSLLQPEPSSFRYPHQRSS